MRPYVHAMQVAKRDIKIERFGWVLDYTTKFDDAIFQNVDCYEALEIL